MTTPENALSPPAPKTRGCFFYGCLTVCILVVLGAVVTAFTVRYAVKQLGAMVERYTEAAPLALPQADLPDREYTALENRVAEFGAAMKAGRKVEPLALTAGELNALIARSPALAEIRDVVRVSLEGDQVKGQVSLPLDRLAGNPLLRKLKGRYLNGTAGLRVELQNGVLNVTLQSLQVKGQPLPESVMGPLRQQNLAADLYKNPQQAEAISRFERVEVRDGQVLVQARGQP